MFPTVERLLLFLSFKGFSHTEGELIVKCSVPCFVFMCKFGVKSNLWLRRRRSLPVKNGTVVPCKAKVPRKATKKENITACALCFSVMSLKTLQLHLCALVPGLSFYMLSCVGELVKISFFFFFLYVV